MCSLLHTGDGLNFSPEHLTDYREEKVTLQQLADWYHVSVTTVWRELKRRGIRRGSRRGRPKNACLRRTAAALARNGCSRQQIARRLGFSPEWVRLMLAEQGIASSMHVLRCRQCGAAVATGHKTYQPRESRHALCAGCLRHRPEIPLARRLKMIRLAGDTSVAQLSARSGLSRAAIGNYEHGRTRPSWDSMEKLARGLCVPVAVLLGMRPNRSRDRQSATRPTTHAG
jgi:transcriptional regulator with XRE-family HTH domain